MRAINLNKWKIDPKLKVCKNVQEKIATIRPIQIDTYSEIIQMVKIKAQVAKR